MPQHTSPYSKHFKLRLRPDQEQRIRAYAARMGAESPQAAARDLLDQVLTQQDAITQLNDQLALALGETVQSIRVQVADAIEAMKSIQEQSAIALTTEGLQIATSIASKTVEQLNGTVVKTIGDGVKDLVDFAKQTKQPASPR